MTLANFSHVCIHGQPGIIYTGAFFIGSIVVAWLVTEAAANANVTANTAAANGNAAADANIAADADVTTSADAHPYFAAETAT